LKLVNLHLLQLILLVLSVLLKIHKQLLQTLLLEQILQLFLLFRSGVVELGIYLGELQILLLHLVVQLVVGQHLHESWSHPLILARLVLSQLLVRVLKRLLLLLRGFLAVRLVLALLLSMIYVFLLPKQTSIVRWVQLVFFKVLQIVLFQ
jgi:hypothetical protein